MNKSRPFFTRDGHLNDEGIALWVEYLSDPEGVILPEEVALHGEECIACKAKMIQVFELMVAEEAPTSQSTVGNSANNAVSPRESLPGFFLGKAERDKESRSWFRMAAVVLALVASCYLIWYFGFKPRKPFQEVYATFYVPYPDIITVKSGTGIGDSLNELFQIGMQAYNGTHYDSALLFWVSAHRLLPCNDTIAFYLANAKMALGSDPSGVMDLLKPLASGEGVFFVQARWYLALVCIREGDAEGARHWLDQIPSGDTYYREKADLLLQEIH